MRLLHLPSSYLPDTLGGTEIYVRHLSEQLRAQGHESSVAWHSGRTSGDVGSETLPALPFGSRAALYSKSSGAAPPGFEELLLRLRPQVVHFHAFTLGAGLDHVRILRTLRVPYVITFHTPAMACPRGTWMLDGREPCDGLLDPKRCASCVLKAQGWPALAADVASRSPISPVALPEGPWTARVALPGLLRSGMVAFHDFFGGAARVIACADFVRERLALNGLSPALIQVLRQALPGETRTRTLRLPTRSRSLRIGFFGRFTPTKGPDLLLAASEELRMRGIAIRTEFAGPILEVDRSWSETLLTAHHASATYLGALDAAALQAWLPTLDLVAIPSRGMETGPLTLLEAWDAGVPAVAVDAGGPHEFMTANDQADLLFAMGSVHGLVLAIERAVSLPARPSVVTVPGMNQLARAHLTIYERVLRDQCG